MNLKKISINQQITLIFLGLLLCNFLLRWGYELHGHLLPYYFDLKGIDTRGTHWYTYMIPSMAHAWGGTLSSLGIGLFPILKDTIGNTASYFVLNLLFVTVVYWLSWLAFGSRIFTITVGLCAAFTTLNNHVYENSSLIILYIPLMFCITNLFAVYQLFASKTPLKAWWWLWGASLALYIMSFEGWLDYYAITVAISPFCFYFLKRNADFVRQKRLVHILIWMTIFFIVYLVIKIKYGYASEPGKEHDLIINYGLKNVLVMIEDLISNFFTFFYTTIITYIPPVLTYSNALILHGSNKLIELQHGYDASNSYLVAMNALLLWRFYAGVAITVFVYFMWKLFVSLKNHFTSEHFLLFVFMFAILFGAPAHLFVKFRPMHIIPWLAYQPFIGQIGLMLFLGYSLHLLAQSRLPQKRIQLIIALVWGSIIVCAFTKPMFYKAAVIYGSYIPNCRSALAS